MFNKPHRRTVVRKGIWHNFHLACACFSDSTPVEIALSMFVSPIVALNQRSKPKLSLRIINRFTSVGVNNPY